MEYNKSGLEFTKWILDLKLDFKNFTLIFGSWEKNHINLITDNLIECTKDLVWITKQVKYPLFFGDGSCRFSGLKEQTPMEFYRANSPPDVDPLA
jgi:hypothetical protein